MIIETKISLKNKTKEELIILLNESIEIINKQNTDKQKLIEYIEKKICEYDETIIELVLQNVLEVAEGKKDAK